MSTHACKHAPRLDPSQPAAFAVSVCRWVYGAMGIALAVLTAWGIQGCYEGIGMRTAAGGAQVPYVGDCSAMLLAYLVSLHLIYWGLYAMGLRPPGMSRPNLG